MSSANTEKKPMGRKLRVLLFASLALNLLIAGLVIGAWASHEFDGRKKRPKYEQVGGPLVSALSRKDRREVGRAIRKTLREERPSKADFKAEFAKVIAALTADPYEQDAVRDAVQGQMQIVVRRADVSVEALLRHFETMSVQERAEYAERLQAVLDRGPRKPSHKDK